MTTVLCWDIDGTLLTTGSASLSSWREAAEEMLGASVDMARITTHGLTDPLIGGQVIEAAGHAATPEMIRSILRTYERRLPRRLEAEQGRVMANVHPILEAVEARDDVFTLLLTGNTRAGAEAKLAHYGLAHYFRHGAFSDRDWERAAIARSAAAMVREHVGEVPGERIYVIGDTPHDVACAEVMGARGVAVATGIYGLDQLGACDPWWLLESLPEADAFLDRLELAGGRST